MGALSGTHPSSEPVFGDLLTAAQFAVPDAVPQLLVDHARRLGAQDAVHLPGRLRAAGADPAARAGGGGAAERWAWKARWPAGPSAT